MFVFFLPMICIRLWIWEINFFRFFFCEMKFNFWFSWKKKIYGLEFSFHVFQFTEIHLKCHSTKSSLKQINTVRPIDVCNFIPYSRYQVERKKISTYNLVLRNSNERNSHTRMYLAIIFFYIYLIIFSHYSHIITLFY